MSLPRFIVGAAAAAALLLLACGGPTEYIAPGTDRAAGTDATIEVEEIEGGNYLVRIEVEHLPPANRLGEGLRTYVVWFTAEGQPAQRAAVLAYDPDDRKGVARATTPNGSFHVTITAERAPNPGSPSEHVVVRQAVTPDD